MWRIIRSLGELQILTRASYLMLVVVPILAGMWPAVKLATNQYNQAIVDSRIALDEATEKIHASVRNAGADSEKSKKIEELIIQCNKRLEGIIEKYSPSTIKNSRLPIGWALAFVSSLCVTIGHVIYQVCAPTLVQRATRHDFIMAEVSEFIKSPSTDKLITAKKINEEFPMEEGEIPERLTEDEQETFMRNALVKHSAFMQYEIASKQRPIGAFASGFSYLIGVLLMGYVVCKQTYDIVKVTWL